MPFALIEPVLGSITDPILWAIIAAVVLVYAFGYDRIKGEGAKKATNVILAGLVILGAGANGRIQEKHDNDLKGDRLIIKNESLHLSKRVSVRLLDVASFDGWGEGPASEHGSKLTIGIGSVEESKAKPDAAQMFDRLKPLVGLSPQSKSIKDMDQAEWEGLNVAAGPAQRARLASKSWCSFAIAGAQPRTMSLFAGQPEAVLDAAGKQIGLLQVVNVFNTTSDQGRESPEACVIRFSAD
jgi:hypothetical protein